VSGDDDDDDDDKVANGAVTVSLVFELSRMLVLAVTDARVCCPVFMAYQATCTTASSRYSTLPHDPSQICGARTTSPTHSPVSIG